MGKKFEGKHRSNSKRKQQPQQIHEPQQQAPAGMDKKTLLSLRTQDQIILMKQHMKNMLYQPQLHIKQLDTIFILTKAASVKVSTTALRILAEIFVGVAPLQPVDMKQIEERREVKITKDQFKVLRFQELLVNQYERYLKMIKQINSKLSVTDFKGDTQMFKQFKKCLLQCILKCFGTLWNFNHFKLLSQLVIKFIKYQETRNNLRQFLSDKNVSLLKAKSKILADIAIAIKQKPETSLPDDLVKIINLTHIDTNHLDKQVDALNFRKKKMTKKLYRQKAHDQKKNKQLRELQKQKSKQKGSLAMKAKIKQQKSQAKIKVKQEVEKQFAEGEAMLSKKQLVKGNSAILQQIFYIYFKILVQRYNSKYLNDVLQGVLSFAHLININLIQTLISHIDSTTFQYRELWLKNKDHNVLENRLRLAFTAESLMNGPLSVYAMDDLKATSALYKILRDVNEHKFILNRQCFRIMGATLEESLLKRRQLSQEVVASLLRQTSILVCRDQIPKMYLLELIRQIASKYSRVGRMFENDNEGYGINGYNPHSLDPQSTNAINTEVIGPLREMAKRQAKKSKKNCQLVEIVERFGRLTFNRQQQALGLDQLLLADLELIKGL